MPRALFVAPSAGVLGGVADWLDYLLPGLEDAGWHCTLGLVDGRFHRAGPYLERHPWHRVDCLRSPTGSREGRVAAIAACMVRQSPDLVLGVNLVDVYSAVRRIRRSGRSDARVAMTLHGLESALMDDIRADCDVMDAVVVTNRLSEALAGEAMANPSRVFYAAYGVAFKPLPVAPRPVSKPFRLLYSGRFENDQKRVLDLAKLVHLLRMRGIPATLSLAGAGPAESELRRELAEHDVAGDVNFLGVLAPGPLAEAYASHDALVITSSWETGPIVAWEAMSHGLPVISSRYVGSGREDALRDGENCLLFPVGDMEAAADAVVRLQDRDTRERIVAGGEALVSGRYSQQASVAAWDRALRNVLALPTLPAPKPQGDYSYGRSRLDRILGEARAEGVRRALGISYRHTAKGGEWPHSGHRQREASAWLAELTAADVPRAGSSYG